LSDLFEILGICFDSMVKFLFNLFKMTAWENVSSIGEGVGGLGVVIAS
jgi:hypothetical protein